MYTQVPIDSLTRQMSPQDVLIEETRKAAETVVATGRPIDPEWIKEFKLFLSKVRPTDQLWEYNDMSDLAGSAGYAIVRDGVVVEHLVILVS